MLIKRSLPKFLSQRLIGLYVLIIVVLVASHIGCIRECDGAGDIFSSTIDQYMERISTIGSNTALFTSGDTSVEIGGGILGAIFSIGLSSLFGLTGTKIVCVILTIFGFILFFNITFADIVSKIKAFFYGVLSGIVEPIGAIITILLATMITPILPYFLAFAAGAMIYVVIEELIPDAKEWNHSNLTVIGVAFGFVLMMILDVALG